MRAVGKVGVKGFSEAWVSIADEVGFVVLLTFQKHHQPSVGERGGA